MPRLASIALMAAPDLPAVEQHEKTMYHTSARYSILGGACAVFVVWSLLMPKVPPGAACVPCG